MVPQNFTAIFLSDYTNMFLLTKNVFYSIAKVEFSLDVRHIFLKQFIPKKDHAR